MAEWRQVHHALGQSGGRSTYGPYTHRAAVNGLSGARRHNLQMKWSHLASEIVPLGRIEPRAMP